jgi:hypothetical protein
MVRVESFTTLAKLGSGKVESFTTVLISRVYLVKTLKTPKYLELSSQEARHKKSINIMREYEPLSLFYTLFTFSLQVTFNSSLIFSHKITLLI